MQKAQTTGDIDISQVRSRDPRRQTVFYNASNYDSIQRQFGHIYQVVLLGTEYVDSKKIGTKPFTVRYHLNQSRISLLN